MAAEYKRLSIEIDYAIEDLYKAGRDWAVKDNQYRVKKSIAFLHSSGKNKEEREANADPLFSEDRLALNLSLAEKEACLEKVRALRTQMSAFQTMVAARRSELEAISYGQSGGV